MEEFAMGNAHLYMNNCFGRSVMHKRNNRNPINHVKDSKSKSSLRLDNFGNDNQIEEDSHKEINNNVESSSSDKLKIELLENGFDTKRYTVISKTEDTQSPCLPGQSKAIQKLSLLEGYPKVYDVMEVIHSDDRKRPMEFN